MTTKLVAMILVAAACLLVVSARTTEVEEKSFPCDRLASNVVPKEYQLELKLDSFEKYSGQVNISLRFPHKNDPDYEQLHKELEGETCTLDSSNTIYLHADPSLWLTDISVTSESCGALDCFMVGKGNRLVRSVKRDSEKQLIAIKLLTSFKPGTEGQLSIKFEGQYRNDKRGIYVSKYHAVDGNVFKYIVSQFQPTDARLGFPVFDEPRFKVPFKVSIVHLSELIARSNTEVESRIEVQPMSLQYGKYFTRSLTATTFKQTPPMSADKLAFYVGGFHKQLFNQEDALAMELRNKNIIFS